MSESTPRPGSRQPAQAADQAAPSREAVLRRTAVAIGATFLLVGVAGFIPGITTDYDRLTFAGHSSGAQLLGVFDVSVLHDLVHLAFGVAGLALARTASGARWYLVGGGLVYLALTAYGALVDRASDANFVPLDHADNWLHLGLGLGMLLLGLVLPVRDRVEPWQR
ncbi:MAG: DUF4383 domain-containing protein [Marmoricola sp.]